MEGPITSSEEKIGSCRRRRPGEIAHIHVYVLLQLAAVSFISIIYENVIPPIDSRSNGPLLNLSGTFDYLGRAQRWLRLVQRARVARRSPLILSPGALVCVTLAA